MKLTPRPAAALMLALAATLAFAASAQALPDPAPGHPGVPQTATIVYQEDFTSGTPTVAGTTTPVNIENYAGGAMADNVSYTAGTDWTSNFGGCNGWILTPNSTAPTVAQDAGCTIHGTVSGGADGNGNPQSAWWFLQQLARAVGEAQNPGSGGAGSVVVASFTNAGKNQTSTLQMLSSPVLTASGAPVVQVGHYYAVSVWFGQVHCQAPGHAAWHDSQEVLSLVGTKLDGTPWQSNISDQPLDPCGGPLITLANNTPAHVVNLTTTALLIPADVDTTTVRVRVDNMQLSYQGNDVAFDLPTLTEVTPQLDKSFGTATAGPVSSTDTVGADSTSSVTFTITNASDLQEAGHPDGTGGVIDGWKFSDDLPAGVTVNGPATTTCQAATIAAPVGGSSIVVTDGSIALGAASCTITVPVKATTTSTAPATYKNNPPTPATVDGKVIDVFGLLAPSEADLDVPSPALTLVKSASKTQVSDADETIVYTFQVTNSGDLTVSGITVADPGPITGTGTLTNAAGTAATSCTPTPSTLTPGQTGTCTLTYTVTQTDIDDEYDLVNVAQASGVDPSGNTVTSNQDTKAVTVVQQPALRLAKAGSTTTVSGAGNTVTYTFTATNPGDTTLTGVTVNDPGPAGGTGTMSATSCIVTPSTLGPDDSGTCTLTYTVSQADMDAGAALVNTAQATGLDPDDVPIYSNQPSFTVTPVRSPVLGLVKTVDPDVVGRAGDPVTYSYAVTNTGNVTINNLSIAESAFTGTGTLPAPVCLATTLGVGESTTCSTTYLATSADIAAKQVDNTAVANGTIPGIGGPDMPVASNPSSASVGVAALSITKTTAVASVAKADEVIPFAITITNDGSTPLTDVTLDDLGVNGTGTLDVGTCGAAGLAVGASLNCEVDYTTTQADIDAGVPLVNQAYATATDRNGGGVSSNLAEADVPIVANPSLALAKDGSVRSVSAAGDTVTYTFTATNDGDVTLTDVTVTDPGPAGGTGALADAFGVAATSCRLTPSTLAPLDSGTCTLTYTVSQADLDAGADLVNTATASGDDPAGNPVTSGPASFTVTPVRTPALDLVKSVSPDLMAQAGDAVVYAYLVTNTGNVTIDNLAIAESAAAFTGTGTLPAATCPVPSLAVGASTTCSATYLVTSADVAAGVVDNTATATGTIPGVGGTDVPVVSPPSSAHVGLARLVIAKTTTTKAVAHAGEVIPYTFTITNQGTTPLTDIALDDLGVTGAGTLSLGTCAAASLAVGQQITCQGTYTVDQADLNAGVDLVNKARATATDEDGQPVTSNLATATAGVATLGLTKAADPAIVVQANTPVGYTFHVTNTGSVPVDRLAIADPGPVPASGVLGPITCDATSLAPGAATDCHATYAVTAADLAGGVPLLNTAHATGEYAGPGGAPSPVVSPDASARVDVVALALTKDASPDAVSAPDQLVTYTFTVTNRGALPLTGVTVTDPGPVGGTGRMTAPVCVDAVLAPGASTTCEATYTVTQADLNAGVRLVNTAVAHGTDPSGGTVTSSPAQASVDVVNLALTKAADRPSVTAAGDRIAYRFVVTNHGSEPVWNLTVDDPGPIGRLGPMSAVVCDATVLAPGASTTCQATYAVVNGDMSAGGRLVNVAVARGETPDGTPEQSNTATAVVVVIQPGTPGVAVLKAASATVVTRAGQTVDYTFTVTNTGTVALTGVSVTDPGPTRGHGPMTFPVCADATLALGASTTCHATYTVVQADLDAGVALLNQATANGTGPGGVPAQATSNPVRVDVAVLGLAKTTATTAATTGGQGIPYTFTLTNTGSATLTSLAVLDPGPAGGHGTMGTPVCAATTLAVGASTTCQATYTTASADLDPAHDLVNTARAFGTAPDGAPVASPPASATVPVPPSPALDLVKTVTPTTFTAAGQTLTYRFVVTNVGNVEVAGLDIQDRSFSGSGPLGAVSCPQGSLVPGAQETCTAAYVTTSADVAAGEILNTAVAVGTVPLALSRGTDPAVTSGPSSARADETPVPALSLVKLAFVGTPSPAAIADALAATTRTAPVAHVGDTVTYVFAVSNTGTGAVTGVAITETAFGGTGVAPAATCAVTTLDAGASTTCTATYEVRPGDATSVPLANTAVAKGVGPDKATPVVSPPATATVDVQADPPGAATQAGGTVAASVGPLVGAMAVLVVAAFALIGVLVVRRNRRASLQR